MAEARAPLVSFIVITRNRCDEVLRSLESVTGQDLADREILLIDNGSTDGTNEAVKRRFPEVRVIALDRNEGVAAARNRGMEEARGGIGILIDDDARFLDPGGAARAAARLGRDDQTAVLSFRIERGATGRIDPRAIPRRRKIEPVDGAELAYFCGAGFAVRRETFFRAGGFWEPLVYAGEELDLSYRILAAGRRIVYAADIRVAHDESATAREPGRWIYHQARHRGWIAARSLPWRYVLTSILLWWPYLALMCLRRGGWGALLRGVRDALLGLPRAVKSRVPVPRSVLAEVRRLSGRLWY